MARKVCLPFSLDWYSSNSAMICRIMLLMGSSPSRHQPDTGLGEAANIELELELIPEEAAETVDQDNIERRRPGRGRVDHALELRPAVVGGRYTRLDIVGRDLPAARGAIALGLAALGGDGQIAVGLPAGRDPEVEDGAKR